LLENSYDTTCNFGALDAHFNNLSDAEAKEVYIDIFTKTALYQSTTEL
jgi:hypothetical protein